ncbi:hypothetical protein J3S85_27705 [Streptomyces lavenduligriseus]|nr:hypothetical protein J3S85_27705 [Streptomyces lavenduligriseus]
MRGVGPGRVRVPRAGLPGDGQSEPVRQSRLRVDGPRSWDADITVRWNAAGGEPVTQRPRNGVLTHVRGTSPDAAEPDTGITLTESDPRAVLLGTLTPEELAARDSVTVTGDFGRLTDLLGHLGAPEPDFAIVTP